MKLINNSKGTRGLRIALVIAVSLLVPACGMKRSGGFFQNDGPPRIPRNLSHVKDAVPRAEPLAATGNKPYTALGKSYVPMKSAEGFSESGMASWYGRQFHGRRTSSGERYDMFKMTAAHPTLPLPSFVRVRNLDNRREVIVRVNDRGPFLNNRVIDMSYAAAHKLGFDKRGTARVHLSVVTPGETVREIAVGRPKAAAKLKPKAAAQPKATAQPKVAAQPPAPSPRIGNDQKIYIQIGAFRELGNAHTVKQQLLSLGYREVVVSESAAQTPASSSAPYRVRLGPVGSIHDANSLLDRLYRDRLGAPRLVVDSE